MNCGIRVAVKIQEGDLITMKWKAKRYFILAGLLFFFFVLLTLCVTCVDTKPIGPEETVIGLASINHFVFRLVGVNLIWYYVTDWLGVIAVLFAVGFGCVGLCQLIGRKDIRKVDRSIVTLGLFYLLTMACYLFFEQVVINYRPVLLGEELEASYPSSHTILVVCIMDTAAMQICRLFSDKKKLYLGMKCVSILLIVVTVIGRLLSGVHWFTDIVGGLLLSGALIVLYRAVIVYLEGE